MDATGHNTSTFSYNRRWLMNASALLAGDTLVLAFALLAASLIRYVIKAEHIPPSRGFFIIPLWWGGAVLLRLAPCWGIGAVEKLRRSQLLLIALFGMAAAFMYLSKSADVTSRIKFVGAYLICVPLVPLVRSWITGILIECRHWGVPTVIYGSSETVTHALDMMRKEPGLGYIPCGFFEDDAAADPSWNIPLLGGLSQYTREAPFALLGTARFPQGELQRLMDGPLSTYRRLIILPELLDLPSVWVMARDFNGVLGLEMVRNLLNPVARIFKRAVEIVMVLLLAPVWVPLMGLLAAVIWMQDRASPFYGQERIGRNGRPFRILKFRTMVLHAEAVLEAQIQNNPEVREEWLRDRKLKRDPRITPFGRTLRRMSLDELPQLFNVLKGDMALVGPRPLPDYHHNEIPPSVRVLREQVSPGVTGLWQVSGRSDAGTRGMEKLDTYYVRNWSFWLDVIILARTLSAVWRGEGAY